MGKFSYRNAKYLLIALALCWAVAGCASPVSPTESPLPESPLPAASAPLERQQRSTTTPDRQPAEVVVQASHYIFTPWKNDPPESLETLQSPAPDPLRLEDFQQAALGNNPAIAETAARLQALEGNWVQSGLPPNPLVGYLAEEIGDAGTAGKQGGFVGQQFITAGKLRLNRRVAAEQIRRAEQELAAQHLRVLTDVRLAYYDALVAQSQAELSRELLDVSLQAVKTSNQLFQAKEISRIAVLQTEIEAQTAQVQLQVARNELMAAWRRLTSLAGLVEMPLQLIAGDLDNAVDLDWDMQLQRLLSESPQLAAAQAEIDRARWALERAQAEVVPDVNVQVAVQHDNASGDTVTGVQAGLPIPLWNKNQGGIEQARGELMAAEQQVQRLQLDLRHRLASAFEQYANARERADTFASEVLPTARETFELVTTGYQQGELGYLDLLAAQRTYFQTNLAYIAALRDLWRATWRIDGMLLEGSLGQD